MMSSIGFAKDSAQPSDQQAKVAVEKIKLIKLLKLKKQKRLQLKKKPIS